MQLFIGGACAGKRAAVVRHFPTAAWYRLDPQAGLSDWREAPEPGGLLEPGGVLVVTGWLAWLEAALVREPDDDRLRHELAAALAVILEAERDLGLPMILGLVEIGRGIVPMGHRDRRLRDLAGWLAQDAASLAERVWYVRHGLVQPLRQVNTRVIEIDAPRSDC
ncbi:bifunctional adenosylcobinamide kinase/adenosylcobinamide-phosphate guanylyltransferase [Halomonas chromatireducens]|uniref:Adenosylcobinamide kinase/adenosylcobinamide-phosphate guanylyltransferase n=1 Tax=Halomonas chromatireducens TaxID=507626 RepID=A0A109UMX3_9GAMM|nr:bifunctional adenosylcobinamide kinase/adenosylcobinamide-phosphate guanylyltransferase [Halomonas chromatireducens]AMD02199.1 adenosylcobinamide kinase/adenosylcobinamide-phosphate guanylyltransferase [Halomonas chromatireducens]